MPTRVIKTGELAPWQYDQMRQWPGSVRPPDLQREVGGYSYDMIVGQPPKHWTQLWFAAEKLWESSSNQLEIRRMPYMEHVREVWMRFDPECKSAADRIQSLLYDLDLTPVALAHGDLTIQNMIGDRLIDPCSTHGLPCREIDEAKMMQSGEGLCAAYRGFPVLDMTGFVQRLAHYVLLLTHYVRMVPHVNEKARQFAKRRIRELTECLR